MAATLVDMGTLTRASVAAVRSVRWPRLREVRIGVPSLCDAGGAVVTGLLRAAIKWALALPRLASLVVLHAQRFCRAAVDALLSGLDHRAARGMPPLRLELEWYDDGGVDRVIRLVAHPAVALVGLCVYTSLHSQAAKREAQRLCEALATPAGPAVLRCFRIRARPDRRGASAACARPAAPPGAGYRLVVTGDRQEVREWIDVRTPRWIQARCGVAGIGMDERQTSAPSMRPSLCTTRRVPGRWSCHLVCRPVRRRPRQGGTGPKWTARMLVVPTKLTVIWVQS